MSMTVEILSYPLWKAPPIDNSAVSWLSQSWAPPIKNGITGQLKLSPDLLFLADL